jgi:N-methylhydantoinase A
MGGTTFKVGVIHGAAIDYQREPMVLRYHYLVPKVDVVSIGAGGGSIVWLDPRTGVPKVGPRSAGATPGPICYGFGGEDPTVTDVDLLLGYLDPRFFLGGRMKLHLEASRRHFKAKIADALGLDLLDAAAAIYKITNAQIYDLLHKVTVERGLDPREHVMFVYGGAAGVHAGVYGAELGVSRIIIPHTASVHGAFGLAASEIVHEYAVTHRVRLPAQAGDVQSIFENLTRKARAQLESEQFADPHIALAYAVDMRYRRQVHVVTVPVGVTSTLTDADLENTFRGFEALYEQRYGKGSAYREAGAEIVTFRVRATGLLRKPEPFRYATASPESRGGFMETREVYFERERGQVRTEFYDFENLQAGTEIDGPAVILTPVTTIAIHPKQRATIDPYKNVVIMP